VRVPWTPLRHSELAFILPWTKSSGSTININKAKEILDEDHYELTKVKDRILDYLSVLELSRT